MPESATGNGQMDASIDQAAITSADHDGNLCDASPPAKKSNYRLLGQSGDLLEEKDDEESLVRIHALLSQWLRMENVVALVGAGASKSNNGPLLAELEKDVINEACKLAALDQECDSKLKEFLPLLERRRTQWRDSATTLHFERWLSYISTAHHFLSKSDSPISSLSFHTGKDTSSSITPSGESIDQLVQILSYLIFLRCSLELPRLHEATSPTAHHAFLGKLVARDSILGRAHIFTTNYDTLFEQAIDDLGIHCFDGFTGTLERRFDPANYSLDLYYPGDVKSGRVRPFDKVIHLYKLHGSINWRRRNDGGEVVIKQGEREYLWPRYLELEDQRTRLQHIEEGIRTSGDHVAILPTDNKFAQTLGMPYAHLFRAFHERLQIPQTFLIIVGYGFGDDHINRIIDQAMTNPSLVLLVITPTYPEALKRRIKTYQESGERAFVLTGPEGESNSKFATFDDFAKRLLPQVQWMDDYIKLRRAERTIAISIGTNAEISE